MAAWSSVFAAQTVVGYDYRVTRSELRRGLKQWGRARDRWPALWFIAVGVLVAVGEFVAAGVLVAVVAQRWVFSQ